MAIELIDFSRRFIPDRLTPLYHTPVYAQLSDAQRLRYNQLHASYFNEQTIFFESAMAQHILHEFHFAIEFLTDWSTACERSLQKRRNIQKCFVS